MANCSAAEVKLIISTNLSDADITSLITLADAEVTSRGLDTRNSNIKKTISMLLTADLIVNKQPPTVNVGPTSRQIHPATTWRQKAEQLILQSGEPPIMIKNDPLPNE